MKGIYDTEWSPWPTIFTYYELNARVNVSSITPSAGDPWRCDKIFAEIVAEIISEACVARRHTDAAPHLGEYLGEYL